MSIVDYGKWIKKIVNFESYDSRIPFVLCQVDTADVVKKVLAGSHQGSSLIENPIKIPVQGMTESSPSGPFPGLVKVASTSNLKSAIKSSTLKSSEVLFSRTGLEVGLPSPAKLLREKSKSIDKTTESKLSSKKSMKLLITKLCLVET